LAPQLPEHISLVMATILRLPHLDIVLDNYVKTEECRNDNVSEIPPQITLRRSVRLKSSSQSEEQEPRGKRRRRYNSVMDEEDEFDEDISKNSPKKREPEHRYHNRMRLQKRENVEPVSSPEDNPAFTKQFCDQLAKEKTMVETLLRKYGFGHWQLPLEDKS